MLIGVLPVWRHSRGWGYSPGGGEVRIDGVDLNNRRAIVRKIGFVLETPNRFDCFPVEYNLALFARLFSNPPFAGRGDIAGIYNFIPKTLRFLGMTLYYIAALSGIRSG